MFHLQTRSCTKSVHDWHVLKGNNWCISQLKNNNNKHQGTRLVKTCFVQQVENIKRSTWGQGFISKCPIGFIFNNCRNQCLWLMFRTGCTRQHQVSSLPVACSTSIIFSTTYVRLIHLQRKLKGCIRHLASFRLDCGLYSQSC